MSRILCIEDSKEFQAYLSSVLKEHSLTHFSTISEAMQAVNNNVSYYDIVLLDISLPDGNGMKVLPLLKANSTHKMVPVIVISSDNDVLSKVAAFGVGADDYISKPPDSSELRARVEARLRWSRLVSNEKSVLQLGNIIMDIERMAIEITMENGSRQPVDLTPLEFKIFRLFLSRPEQVFSREHIIERVWGFNHNITARTVDAHISNLRRKVLPGQLQIETVLGAGYKVSLKPLSGQGTPPAP